MSHTADMASMPHQAAPLLSGRRVPLETLQTPPLVPQHRGSARVANAASASRLHNRRRVPNSHGTASRPCRPAVARRETASPATLKHRSTNRNVGSSTTTLRLRHRFRLSSTSPRSTVRQDRDAAPLMSGMVRTSGRRPHPAGTSQLNPRCGSASGRGNIGCSGRCCGRCPTAKPA